jgi:hypothetical protein
MSFPDATLKFDTPREIHVTRVEVEKTGINKKTSKGWTLYKVFAEELDGTPITEELKTFDAVNGIVTVTAEAFIKDGAIQHYTLKLVRPPKPTKPNGGAPDQRIAELESRVTDLERKLNSLIRSIDTPLEVQS